MSLVFTHWSYDPFVIVVGVVALVHAVGLRRLNATAAPARRRRRTRQALRFYAGLAVLLLAVMSPIDYWSDSYFFVHMIQHLLLIFGAPVPIVAGAPWLPLLHGLPARVRRPILAAVARGRPGAPLRWVARARWWPWVGVAGLNAALVFWHLPGPFDLAEENPAVHVWLMHGSFFAFGMLFWLQMTESRPLRIRLEPAQQIAAIFVTAVTMWVLAMALSILSRGSWYPWYQAHEGPLLPVFADQQIGAGIMWICGDFWAIPAMTRAVRRLIDARGPQSRESIVDALVQRVRRGVSAPLHEEMARRTAPAGGPVSALKPDAGRAAGDTVAARPEPTAAPR